MQLGYALIMAYNGITTRNLPETSYLGSRVRQKISTLSYASPSMCPGTANSKCNVNAHIPFSCEYEEEKKGQIVPILLKPFFFFTLGINNCLVVHLFKNKFMSTFLYSH